MKDGERQGQARRASGHVNGPALQVICLVSLVFLFPLACDDR